MRLTVKQLVENTELNDFKVNSIELNIESKSFKVDLEGTYWFRSVGEKPEVMEKGGLINITDYDSFEARYFCPKDKLWRTLNYESLEMIDEVNEKSYRDEVLRLAGFGKESGHWIEYLIKAGNYEIYFNE